MRYREILFICLLILLSEPRLAGQDNQYKFSRLNVGEGLSNNMVNCFLRDRKGFMWIGTMSGLNRFDGYTFKVFRSHARDSSSLVDNNVIKLFEDPDGRIWAVTYFGTCVYDHVAERFERNTDKLLKGYGLPRGIITDIVKDREGIYWFLHNELGLFRYDPVSRKIQEVRKTESAAVSSLSDGPGNLVWIIYTSGLVEAINRKTLGITYSSDELKKQFSEEVPDYRIQTDNDGDLWIYVNNYRRGVFYLDVSERKFTHFNKASSPVKLNNDIVRGVAIDENGLIWVGTDHGGINLIDKNSWTVEYLLSYPGDNKSLSQSSINAVYKDYENILWVGTTKKGVSYYHENLMKFRLFQHQDIVSSSLPYDDINQIVEDVTGNFWIGTNGGGLLYFDRKANTYKQYLHDPENPNSLCNNVIVSLLFDHENVLWIGTYHGGLNSFDGKTFKHFTYNPSDSRSISDNSVWKIIEDRDNNLWMGTLVGGLNLYDRKKNEFTRFGDTDGIHTGYVPALLEDANGTIWAGTGFGISFRKRGESKFTHILGDGSEGSLSNNSIMTLLLDSRNHVWIGTQDGLHLYNEEKNTFRVFRMEDGLPHNTIMSMAEDDNHNLWLGTPNGLSNMILEIDPTNQSFQPKFKNYDELDGLQGKYFNHGTACKTHNGEVVFGGSNGFNLIRPDEIRFNTTKPPVVLLDFQIFNKSILRGEKINSRVILKKSILETNSVTLKHSDNVFSIEFAALSFFHSERNQYRYKLEGFNKEWLTTSGNDRKVTYTNLDPGEYQFKVMASNSDGYWNEDGAVLNIIVLPPFWKTKLAFLIYLIVMIGALIGTRQVVLQRERMKFKIEKERSEAQRIHELDMLKIRFFTNVSHEFRTPLTLIMTPMEKLMKQTKGVAEKEQFLMIYRNARRLLNLVNQLLDFRRMEVQEVKLNPSEGDIIHFIQDVASSFSDLSEKKNIQFSCTSDVASLEALFDQNKMERILFNLISNAFKFTQEGGKVDVHISLFTKEDNVRWLKIAVKDSGIGIPSEKIDKIFERFFQHDLPASMTNQGSGIGLSITKEFVRIHGGTIMVESEPEKGSCFTVQIPVWEITGTPYSQTNSVLAPENIEVPISEGLNNYQPLTDGGKRKPVVLLVEDNEDFRFYLKDNLKVQYTIIEAQNGKEGLSQALTHIPDLIVSDVMMPEINGIELCKKLRGDARTSHIPIILLTARSGDEQKKEGFETGADDYVTKPFNFEILQSRIKNLIALRASFHKSMRNHIEVKASSIQVSSLDEKLIEKAIKYVEENISDPDFSVETLSHELGMSRVHLYKKLTSLTGKSPIEFIRTIRLQRAAQLLEKSQLTVAEVAYKVGFNNPKYFAKYFREQYEVLPSVYAARQKETK